MHTRPVWAEATRDLVVQERLIEAALTLVREPKVVMGDMIGGIEPNGFTTLFNCTLVLTRFREEVAEIIPELRHIGTKHNRRLNLRRSLVLILGHHCKAIPRKDVPLVQAQGNTKRTLSVGAASKLVV